MSFNLIRLLTKGNLRLLDQEKEEHLFIGWDSNGNIVTESKGVFYSYSEKEIFNWSIKNSSIEDVVGYLC